MNARVAPRHEPHHLLLPNLPRSVEVGRSIQLGGQILLEVVDVLIVNFARVGVVRIVSGSVLKLVQALKRGVVELRIDGGPAYSVDADAVVDPNDVERLVALAGVENVILVADLHGAEPLA